MKIAYFAGTMREGHDGVTRVLYQWIHHLRLGNVPAMFFSAIVPEPERRPVPMIRVPSIPFPLYKDYRLALPGTHAFEDALARFAPDVLHVNSPCSLGYAAVRYGERHGIPVVATYHTHFPSYAKYYNLPALRQLGWRYLEGFYNACSTVLVPSQPILDELRDHGFRNLTLLPHGVDTHRFHPGFRSERWRQEHGLTGKTVLLFAGRLVWEKDLRVLAAAWTMLRERHANAALVLVGDGPARQELAAMIPDALFLGHQDGQALSSTFASSDFLVFPSTTETFGNVLLEAMASGVVPVAAAEGGAAGVITDGVNGLLAAPRNAAHFAEQISRAITDRAHAALLRQQALDHARAQNWQSIFDRMMLQYQAALAARRTRSTTTPRRAA